MLDLLVLRLCVRPPFKGRARVIVFVSAEDDLPDYLFESSILFS